MSFHQFIQYKALDRKFSSDNDFILESISREIGTANAEMLKASMKNVCALIHNDLFNELDNVCGLLEISKRKFIEGAIIEALAQANTIISEVGLLEYYNELSEAAEARKVTK